MPGEILQATDYADLARARLSTDVWDYVDGGSGAELTIAANRAAFDAVRIAPRFLVDVSVIDTATKLFGTALPSPIGIAPTAYQALVHPGAEIDMVRGAAGHLCVMSFFSTRTVEQMAAAATGPLWMQLYWLEQRAAVADVARRAEAAGFRALVLTVDAPRIGQRFRDARNAFAVPDDVQAVNIDPALTEGVHEQVEGASALAGHADMVFDTAITWADLAWLRRLTSLPIVLKGILTAHDARLAIEHGVDAIVVSNHGGRQVDGAVASLHALPAVAQAVGGRIPVLLDSGVRRGRDAFVALAAGADAVLLGRPPLWALATGGADAVRNLMGIVDTELAHLMAIAGRPTLADITPDALA